MDTYKDTRNAKTVIICNADELQLLANATFYAVCKWLKKCNFSKDETENDMFRRIADQYGDIMDKLNEKVKKDLNK